MSPVIQDLPEDFEAFWQETAAEAFNHRLDYHRSNTNDFDLPGFTVEKVEFAGMNQRLFGWLAYPNGQRRCPGFVWIPPYGRESLLPNQYGTREGFASFSLNFHGESAFHQEKYRVERGYFAQGAEDPSQWVFRTMLQNAIVASRVFQAQIEVDENRLGAMGMSQGAGIAIWLAANCPFIKAVCADMPFLSGIAETLQNSIYRYPLKEVRDYMDSIPLGEARVLNTLSYFDTSHQATRCKVPTQVSLGMKDPACRPESVRRTFEALPRKKMLVQYDWGHDWHPDMVPNNREWLLENMP